MASLLFSKASCEARRRVQDETKQTMESSTMGLQQAKLESLPFVTAELNYLAPTPGKPRTYAFDPPPGEPKSTALPEPHDVPVFDARRTADSVPVGLEGFALVRHPTSVTNFYADNEIRRVFYPAVESFRRAS